MTAFDTDPGLAGLPGLRHGFFGRAGGVSEGVYASLNCARRSPGDPPENTTTNRGRVAAALGAEPESLLIARQTHSTTALPASAAWPADAVPEADAIVTGTPGLLLAVQTADCVPVLLAEPQARLAGAVHAGWRGALAGVIGSAVACMTGMGARPSRIRAAVGPAISAGAYEVGEEFRDRFVAEDPESAGLFALPEAGRKLRFDLPGYVCLQIARAGLAPPGRSQGCTYTDGERYFSHRRQVHRSEADCGRQLSAVLLLP